MDAIYISTDDDLISMNPKTRKCYYENEYNLTIYSKYSYDTCIHECKLLNVYKTYGCLLWNQPSIYSR